MAVAYGTSGMYMKTSTNGGTMKGVVVREGAFVQVESDTARVDDVHPRLISPRGVDDDGAESLAEQAVDAAGAVELGARHAVIPRCTPLVRLSWLRKDVMSAVVFSPADVSKSNRAGEAVEFVWDPEAWYSKVSLFQSRYLRAYDHGDIVLFAALRVTGVRHAFRCWDTGVSAVVGAEAGHGQPPQRLAVPAGLERRAGLVVDDKVADVAVAAEDLDGGRGVLSTHSCL